MAASKTNSVFVLSFAAGLLASALVLVSSEESPVPQTYFGLPVAEEPAGMRQRDADGSHAEASAAAPDASSSPRAHQGVLKSSTGSPFQLAVINERTTARSKIVLVASTEELPRGRAVPEAPFPPRRVSRPSDEVEARNWSEVPPSDREANARLGTRPEAPAKGALRDWLRDRLSQANASKERVVTSIAAAPSPSPEVELSSSPWIDPTHLREQLTLHAEEGNEEWAAAMLTGLTAAASTSGPEDPATHAALAALEELAAFGMRAADEDHDLERASQTRRAALAVSRRVALWQAAGEVCCHGQEEEPRDEVDGLQASHEVRALLDCIERFESVPSVVTAAEARQLMDQVAVRNVAGVDSLTKAFQDHYLAPNLRISVAKGFADRLMPAPGVENGRVVDTILGRDVRGNRTVKQSSRVVFVPDSHDVRLDLEVHGDVFARTVTDAGPVLLNSQSTSTFTVRKPIKLCAEGLLVGDAQAIASNRSRVSGMQTSFDGIPLMGSLVRSIARNQQEAAMPEANREAARKVINQACRDVDALSEPQLADLERRVTEKIWKPLVSLGLDPVVMAMETTEELATVRLRLAGEGQLSGNTPRPRVPAGAELSVQIHDTCLNNAFDRLDIAGRRFPLEDLYVYLGQKVGVDVEVPDDLPEGVVIGFEEEEPIRVECHEGLVHVTLRIDSIESGRRDWYDFEAGVTYRLVSQNPQVVLEREGPIRIGGEGHRGRFELALRTVVGKIFPKEKSIPVLPPQLASDPRLANLDVIQAVVTDGWLAIALAPPAETSSATVLAPGGQALRK